VTGSGLRELRRGDRLLVRTLDDTNKNGLWDRITLYRADSSVAAVWTDDDEDGVFESSVEQREDGTTATWIDLDRDGVYDEGRVTGRDGRGLQTLVWQPGAGFVPKNR
jgi:hypothetical protein